MVAEERCPRGDRDSGCGGIQSGMAVGFASAESYANVVKNLPHYGPSPARHVPFGDLWPGFLLTGRRSESYALA